MLIKDEKLSTAKQILSKLQKKNIELHLDGNKIKFRAPENTFTNDLKEEVKYLRSEIIELLKGNVDNEIQMTKLPLTDVQSAYLIGKTDAVLWGGVGCQSYIEVNFGRCSTKDLKNAWIKLIDFYDMLRAKITETGIEVVDNISSILEVLEVDLRDKSQEFVTNELEKIREKFCNVDYDGNNLPLFKTAITLRNEGTFFHLSIDLTIVDFASVQILIDELGNILDGQDLKPLNLDYKTYVKYSESIKNSPKYNEDKSYWINRIKNFSKAPLLPRDGRAKPITAEATPKFYRIQRKLKNSTWNKIKSISSKNGLTISSVVLTAYALTISKWSENKNFVLNLPIQNRLGFNDDVKRLVGDFTSVNLLEVDFSNNDSFIDKVKEISKQLIEDIDHSSFSGVEVLRELSIQKGREHALMPYVFTGVLKANKKRGSIEYGISQTPQVWIDCQVIDESDVDTSDYGLFVSWDIRNGALRDDIVNDLFEYFWFLLEKLADDEKLWLEKEKISVKDIGFEYIERKKEVYIQDNIIKYALENGSKIAVIDNQKEITYNELLIKAMKVAAYINTVDKGDKISLIGIKIPKKAEQVIAILGVLISGHAYLPLNLSQPELRERNILNQAEVEIILTENILEEALKFEPIQNPFLHHNFNNLLAYAIFTSGSTGTPKGVIMSHKAVENTLNSMQNMLSVTSNDSILGLAEISFDLSVYDIFGVLSAGGTLILPDPDRISDPSHWSELLDKYNVTLWNSVPAQGEMLVNYVEDKLKINSLRTVLLSGDMIKISLPEKLKKIMPNTDILSLGGATEAGIWSNYHYIEPSIKEYPTILYGKALEGQYISVVDSNLKKCPFYVTGEIVIGGGSLASGYLNDKKLSDEKFISLDIKENRMYRTGDKGRILPNGEIEFLGRIDDQVKINGYRIELGEIESALLEAPEVKNCSVIHYKENGKEKIEAFIEENFQNKCDSNEIKSIIEDSIRKIKCKDENISKELILDFNNKVENAITSSVYSEFKNNGAFRENEWCSLEYIKKNIKVDERYISILNKWLNRLVNKGYLIKKDNEYKDLNIPDDNLKLWDTLQNEPYSNIAPKCVSDYIKKHADNVCKLFSREINPLVFLFPEGNVSIAEDMYGETIISEYFNRIIAQVILSLSNEKKSPIKILEVGGGTGATTNKIIEKIESQKIDYLFTDVSKFFLGNIQNKYPFVETMILNLDDIESDKDPREIDIIVAAGVLNNTKNIPLTLSRLKNMLKDTGIILITEPVGEHIEIDVSQAFMMPKHEDIRSESGNCFLSEKEWSEVVEKEDFNMLASVPPTNSALHEFNHNLFIITKQYYNNKFDYNEFLRKYLPEVMIPHKYHLIDKIPLTNNSKIDRKALIEIAKNNKAITENIIDPIEETKKENKISSLEKEIIEIMKSVSNQQSIGVDENLLQIGFDSLILSQASGQIVNSIEKASEIKFDEILKVALSEPFIREIALYIEENSKGNYDFTKEENSINQGSELENIFNICEKSSSKGDVYFSLMRELGVKNINIDEYKKYLPINEKVFFVACEEEASKTLLLAGEQLLEGNPVEKVILINPKSYDNSVVYLGDVIIFSSNEKSISDLNEIILGNITSYSLNENNIDEIKSTILKEIKSEE